MSLTLYLVRHGERADHVNPLWCHTAAAPYDPPLTAHGVQQAQRTGAYIHDRQRERDGASDGETEYTIVTSPFLRTAETSSHLAEGIASSLTGTKSPSIKIRIDSSLAEWHTAGYYLTAVPDKIIDRRVEEFHEISRRDPPPLFDVEWDYRPLMETLPEYPESIDAVLKRSQLALDGITTPFVRELHAGSKKHIALVIITHGWVFSRIQELCSPKSRWIEAGYCGVSSFHWVQDVPPHDQEDALPGYWKVDLLSSVEHLKGL